MATYEGKYAEIHVDGVEVKDMSGWTMSVTAGTEYKMPLGSEYPQVISGTSDSKEIWGGQFSGLLSNSAGAKAVIDAAEKGDLVSLKLYLAAAPGGQYLEGNAYLNGYGMSIVNGDMVKVSFSYSCAGPLKSAGAFGTEPAA